MADPAGKRPGDSHQRRSLLDAEGSFSSLRAALLSYYPEDVRRRKLAAQCALAAQAGQYNYYRCMRRGEEVSAMIALTKFVEHVQAIIFLLNRRYRPYYKWTQRALEALPVLSRETAPLIRRLTSPDGKRAQTIETICAHIIQELKRQGLSDSGSDFLLDHARCIQAGIEDKTLRSAQLFQE
ncbi:MAG: DUF4037 domain-containing protein [Lachnospiraceae bacterium]|nr:DUF4037 domain-containing protein [Lachnospiraceae bacterium]